MLSTRARYALKALLAISADTSERPLRSRYIADNINAPLHFVEAIMFELKSAGFVSASRGRSGGYRLSIPPSEISYADVIRAIDGPIAMPTGTNKAAIVTCEDEDFAERQIRIAMSAAQEAATSVLQSFNIGSTLKE